MYALPATRLVEVGGGQGVGVMREVAVHGARPGGSRRCAGRFSVEVGTEGPSEAVNVPRRKLHAE